jgi:hypothetical protein
MPVYIVVQVEVHDLMTPRSGGMFIETAVLLLFSQKAISGHSGTINISRLRRGVSSRIGKRPIVTVNALRSRD